MVSKAVKLPVELIDFIKENEGDVPPGDVLHKSYNEFVKLRRLADVLSDVGGDDNNGSVADTIINHIKDESCKYETFDKKLVELSSMLQGLSIFFKKFGG